MAVNMQRVSVIGTTGTGKSTFAKELARRLECPHIELDALHWEPGWVEVPEEMMRGRVEAACSGETWVVDGNYGCVRDLVWARADTVVWLDFGLPVVLWRSVRRTVRRVFRGEPCCNGNRETLRKALSSDSIVLWALTTHGARRRKYPVLLRDFGEKGGRVVRLRTPKETSRWLEPSDGR